MTAEEAKANQDELSKYWNLSWWYGTKCEKCCGVYPKLMHENTLSKYNSYFQCEVCGKRTTAKLMPWEATEAWNKHQYVNKPTQMSLF